MTTAPLGADVMAQVVKLLTSEAGNEIMSKVRPQFSWHKEDPDYDFDYTGIHTVIYPMDSLFWWGCGDVIEVTDKNLRLLREAYDEILPSYLAARIKDDAIVKAHAVACDEAGRAYRLAHPDRSDREWYDEHGNYTKYVVPKMGNRVASDYASAIGDLFAAKVLGMRPQGAGYEYIPEDLWDLFDACGPTREVGPGNPRPHPGE